MSKVARTSYAEARPWRATCAGTGGEQVASGFSLTSRSIAETSTRPSKTAMKRCDSSGQTRAQRARSVEAERERGPYRAWELRRAERAGRLIHETDPEFVAGVQEGRQLD